jgi:hypothetical protein
LHLVTAFTIEFVSPPRLLLFFYKNEITKQHGLGRGSEGPISQNQITRWKSIFLRTSNFDAQISLTLKKPQINVDQFVIFDLDLTYGHLHNTRQTPLLLAQIW